MKILMLIQDPRIKGPVPKHTPLLISGLETLGCLIATELWGRHSDAETLGEKIVGRTTDIWRARERLRREQFDVVVVKTAHDWATLGRDILLLLATRRLRRQQTTILQFHGSVPDLLFVRRRLLFRIMSGLLVRLCDGALFLSSEEARLWRAFCPAGRFRVVANPQRSPTTEAGSGADSLAAYRARWRIQSQVQVILFASRVIAEKGVFDLLRAFHELAPKFALHLLIAGEGADEDRVRSQIDSLGLSQRVTMTGYLEGSDLLSAFRIATVFALPTRCFEGFPTAISEAMREGLPIVTTPTGGVLEHLRDGENAIFVPKGDAPRLAAAIKCLIESKELRETMSIKNREQVRKFDPLVVSRQYLEAVHDIARSVNRNGAHRSGGSTARLA